MKIKVVTKDITGHKCDALVVNLFEGVKKPGGATGAVNKALGGSIASLVKRGEFKGKKGETAVVEGLGKIAAERVIVVGLGKNEKFDLEGVRSATAAAAAKAQQLKAAKIGTVLHGAGAGGIDPEAAARATAEGTLLGLYKFDKYLSSSEKKKDEGISEVAIIERDASKARVLRRGVKTGEILGGCANYARDLVNEPPNVMTPEELASKARAMARGGRVKVKVYRKKELIAMKMNAFLGVNRGSKSNPQLITIEYKGDPDSSKMMAIIGKGITFDSGGLSLKPSSAMATMKCDMAGAAAVMGAIDAISKLGLKVNVTCIVPTTDNKTGSDAQCVGDIVRASNGKTIEVMNTDAEGRLILSDAIAWAGKKGMEPIIDLATLTGACVVALGTYRTGLFTLDDTLADLIEKSGEEAGERMWRMPMDEEYFEAMKTDVADMKNVGDRNAGAITAALFLKEFTDDKKWAHLDIAGTAFMEKKQGYFGKGATGMGVRTLAHLAMNM